MSKHSWVDQFKGVSRLEGDVTVIHGFDNQGKFFEFKTTNSKLAEDRGNYRITLEKVEK